MQWEDELLVAMVLAKVSSALRVPGKMDMPAMQVSNVLRYLEEKPTCFELNTKECLYLNPAR